MAAWLRSSQSLFVFAFICYCEGHWLIYPKLNNVFVINDISTKIEPNFRQVTFELRGQNIDSSMQIKLTSKENLCNDDINFKVLEKIDRLPNIVYFKVLLPIDVVSTIYFCVQQRPPISVNFGGGELIKWSHAGGNVFIKLSPRTTQHYYTESGSSKEISQKNINSKFIENRRHKRQPKESYIRVNGFRVEEVQKEVLLSEDGSGVPLLLGDSESVLRLFGEGIDDRTWVAFTQDKGHWGGSCLYPVTKGFQVESSNDMGNTGRIRINLPYLTDEKPFYICVKKLIPGIKLNSSEAEAVAFLHQGTEIYLQIKTFKKLLPLFASVCIIIFCLTLSALFSGLNLGLMSLDRTELKILCNTGNEDERKYARIIQPVRDHGNFLLCSILLGNVLVNSTFTILLDDLTSGVIAVVFATLAIVMFGEISPQALCSRHGLAVGARTIYITKATMLLTFPLSYPISKILDAILGEEIGNVYNRERLKELVKVTTDINDLDKDEVNIISGALELRKKTVADVMTRIEDAFMLDYESTLDFETVSEIMKSGFSRIPVYEGNRNNIVTVLYIKDLAFIDPDDNTPLKTLCQFYQNPCNFVFEDQTLDVMFKQFKEGNKGHMAFVTRVNNEGECDPFYEILGLVTLEDVIEELIQAEIMDETDVFTDNRSKRKRQDKWKRQDFSMFAERRENQRIHISAQLTLATYQYLSTSLEYFRSEAISEQTLRRLLKQDVFRHVKKNKKQDRNDQSTYIYQQGKAVDYFVLILEGRVEVTVGKENLVFESGPFTYFGVQALVAQGSIGKSPTVTSRRPTAATVSPVTAESPSVPLATGTGQMGSIGATGTTAITPATITTGTVTGSITGGSVGGVSAANTTVTTISNITRASHDGGVQIGIGGGGVSGGGGGPTSGGIGGGGGGGGGGIGVIGGAGAATTGIITTASSQMGSLQSLNIDALQRFSFQPDYSVRAITDVLYMCVPRSLYLAAKRATLMERSAVDRNVEIDDDDKLLYSLDGDEESSHDRMSPKQNVDVHASLVTPRVNSPQQQQQQHQQQNQQLHETTPNLNHTTANENNNITSSNYETSPNLDPNGIATFASDDRDRDDVDTPNPELTTLLKRQPQQSHQNSLKKDTDTKPS